MTSTRLRMSSAIGDAGFTLAELLVALALIAVVLGFATGGIRFGIRAWDATRVIDENAEIGLARDMLRACIGAATPLSSVDKDGRIDFAFQGSHDRLALACPLGRSDGSAPTTFHRLSLHLLRRGARLDLVAKTGPYLRRVHVPGSESEPAVHTLVRGIAGVALRYFGDLGDGDGRSFHDQWTHPNRLPELIALAVSFDDGDRRLWPELAIAIRSGGG